MMSLPERNWCPPQGDSHLLVAQDVRRPLVQGACPDHGVRQPVADLCIAATILLIQVVLCISLAGLGEATEYGGGHRPGTTLHIGLLGAIEVALRSAKLITLVAGVACVGLFAGRLRQETLGVFRLCNTC